MTNSALQSLAQKITQCKIKCMGERSKRWEVEQSEAYLELEDEIGKLQEQIQAFNERKQEMLADLPDSNPELLELTQEMVKLMKETGVREIDNITAKFKKKKEVDTRAVMEFLQGDLDNFFVLAKIQQNTLKDFAKANPEYKGITRCIETVSEELVDVDISLPE